ncbi:transcription initiation factor TFIID subunit 11-like [Raphanus sativus]|nr:transcription initiation factor TFIID subunit 11-like [Raphanus sativus]
MKRYKNPFETAIEEEQDESSPDSPVCDGGRSGKDSDDDVGLLRQEIYSSQIKHEEAIREYHRDMNNDDPRLSVVSGIAKMFVGELVETARLIMVKRKESGHIRPCHIRESYRSLKLQGKVPQKTVPRLFR